jgi:cytochrome c oxidase subunit 2
MTARQSLAPLSIAPLDTSPTIPFDALFTFLMVGAFLVSILITVLVVTALLRARRQAGMPRQEQGNTRLEVTWTVIPAFVVIFIFGFMFYEMRRGSTPGKDIPQGQQPDIEVIGHQWWWEFRYPKQGGVATANELHLPQGERALVALTSADVQHDFWVPELGQKMDLYPGKQNYVYLDTRTLGTFLGVCAEFCGTQHAWMRIRVIVQPQAEFDAWAAQLRAAPAPQGDQAARGAQLFNQYACGSCHLIAGTTHQGSTDPESGSIAAPPLTNFATRQTISAGVVPNTPENLIAYLRDPQAVKPGVLMPNFRLTDDEIAALAAYLTGLK